MDAPFETVLPHTTCLHSAILNPFIGKKWFFGYTGTYIGLDWELDYMGTIRFVRTGQFQVLMVPGKHIAEALLDGRLSMPAADDVINKAAMQDTVKRFVKSVFDQSPETVPMKLKSAGVTIYIATVNAADKPVALVTPPGFLTYVKVDNLKPCSGLWAGFMAKGTVHMGNYAAVCPENVSSKESIIDLFKV